MSDAVAVLSIAAGSLGIVLTLIRTGKAIGTLDASVKQSTNAVVELKEGMREFKDEIVSLHEAVSDHNVRITLLESKD